jgi:hypothetical protein
LKKQKINGIMQKMLYKNPNRKNKLAVGKTKTVAQSVTPEKSKVKVVKKLKEWLKI